MKLFNGPSLDKRTFKHALLFTLLFFLAAHAFCVFNLTFSSGSVMLSVSNGYNAQMESGQFLQPLYWRVRGSLSAPLLVGLLSVLYLALLNAAIVWLLELSHPLALFALCGAMTVNPAVTSILAASLNTADAAFLGVLLAALAAVCFLRMRWWWVGLPLSAVLLVAAQGLETTALSFFSVLVLLGVLNELIQTPSPRILRHAVRLLVVVFLSILLGQAIALLMPRSIDLEGLYRLQTVGNSFMDLFLYPFRMLLAPATAYPTVSILLRVFLFALVIPALVAACKKHGLFFAVSLAYFLFILPILVCTPISSLHAYPQFTMAMFLLDVLPILLLARLLPENLRLHRLAAGAFGVIFLGSIIFSNQVYLKKNLEFESTLSLMSRAIQRIEETDGYNPGYTPVAIIGTPEDSAFSVPHKGFEHLEVLEAAQGHYAIATDEDMLWYAWTVLGYPLNAVSTFDLQQLKANPQVQAMPVFPSAGCCAFVGDTLVLKLSPANP